MAAGRQGGRLDGLVAILTFDHVRYAVNSGVIAKIIAVDFHQAVIGAAPGAGSGSARTNHDNAARTGQYVKRPVPFRRVFFPCPGIGYAHHVSAGAQRKLFDLFGPRFEGYFIHGVVRRISHDTLRSNPAQ